MMKNTEKSDKNNKNVDYSYRERLEKLGLTTLRYKKKMSDEKSMET